MNDRFLNIIIDIACRGHAYIRKALLPFQVYCKAKLGGFQHNIELDCYWSRGSYGVYGGNVRDAQDLLRGNKIRGNLCSELELNLCRGHTFA